MYIKELNEEEIKMITDIQREMIESFAKRLPDCRNEKTYEIFYKVLILFISNMMNSIGINKIDLFLDGLSKSIIDSHEFIQKNNSYMIYKNCEKISEGEKITKQ